FGDRVPTFTNMRRAAATSGEHVLLLRADAVAVDQVVRAPGTLHAPNTGSATRTGAGASSGHPTTYSLARDKTEAEAKQGCAGDPVVWANISSKVQHASGDKYYGHTKRGAYVCMLIGDYRDLFSARGTNVSLLLLRLVCQVRKQTPRCNQPT